MSVYHYPLDTCAETCSECGRDMVLQHRGLMACPYCGFTLLEAGSGPWVSVDAALSFGCGDIRAGSRARPGRGRWHG